MKPIIKLTALLLIMGSLASCEKGLMTYEGEPAIYFSNAQKAVVNMAFETASSSDSTLISFVYSQKMDSLIEIPVGTSGKPVDQDRVFTVAVNPQSTAVEGLHYDALPENLVIPKNAVAATIPIKLKRTADMQSNTYTIILDLLPNENFVTNVKTRTFSTGKTISSISYKIGVDDKIKKPMYWQDGYYGAFSRKKLFLVCEVTNITPAYMDDPNKPMPPSEMKLFAKVVQQYLNGQKNAGNTIYEEDNTTVMTMGPGAK